jgi:hypothetical protein
VKTYDTYDHRRFIGRLPMNESIMKTDRLGRLRYAPEQKAAIIA